jgi:gas vesicle structural protein
MRENVAILSTAGNKEVSLLEVLDHVVNKGVLIQGSIVISLAGVDLIYLGLNVVLTSVETALRYMEHERPTSPPNAKGRKE